MAGGSSTAFIVVAGGSFTLFDVDIAGVAFSNASARCSKNIINTDRLGSSLLELHL